MMINSTELELNKIRIDLSEKTKQMTTDDRVKYFNETAIALAYQYGFKIVPSQGTLSNQQIKKTI